MIIQYLISLKFKAPLKTLTDTNRLVPCGAIFPHKTLLIPLTNKPYLNPSAISSPQYKESSPGVLILNISDTKS